MTLRATIDVIAVESPSLPRVAHAGVTDGHRAGPSEMVADMFPGAFANPALFGEDSMITAAEPSASLFGNHEGDSGEGDVGEADTMKAPVAQVSAPVSAAADPKAAKKMCRFSDAMDRAMLVAVNCLGAHKQVGHGKKGPAFADVCELLQSNPKFAAVKDAMTGKKCSDRFDRIVKDHRAERNKREKQTGTDDEEVTEEIQILDDICEVADDAREELDNAAEKKREIETGMKDAGMNMRYAAMERKSKRARREEITAADTGSDETPPSRARTGAVVNLDSDDDDAVGGPARTAAAALRASSPTGGRTTVTPLSVGRRGSSARPVKEDDELDMIAAAEEREGKKLENDSARLEMEKESLAARRDEIELRRQQHELAKAESEARMRLDRERADEDKQTREADRVEREAQTVRNDKILQAVLGLMSRTQ